MPLVEKAEKRREASTVPAPCRAARCAIQVPWILSATVRENILFGEEYDHSRYKKVRGATASWSLWSVQALLEERIEAVPFSDLFCGAARFRQAPQVLRATGLKRPTTS